MNVAFFLTIVLPDAIVLSLELLLDVEWLEPYVGKHLTIYEGGE